MGILGTVMQQILRNPLTIFRTFIITPYSKPDYIGSTKNIKIIFV
jgi:hypothetical protein